MPPQPPPTTPADIRRAQSQLRRRHQNKLTWENASEAEQQQHEFSGIPLKSLATKPAMVPARGIRCRRACEASAPHIAPGQPAVVPLCRPWPAQRDTGTETTQAPGQKPITPQGNAPNTPTRRKQQSAQPETPGPAQTPSRNHMTPPGTAPDPPAPREQHFRLESCQPKTHAAAGKEPRYPLPASGSRGRWECHPGAFGAWVLGHDCARRHSPPPAPHHAAKE
jgi:hypothetical protein